MRVPQADWSRWLAAGGIAIMVLAGVVALFRLPQAPSHVAPKAPPPTVTLAPETDSLLSEEAMLRDPTPLFLPTRWNVAENALLTEARRESGAAFQDYPAALKFAGSELRLELPLLQNPPAKPGDVFGIVRPQEPLIGLGQTDAAVAPLMARTAFVQVTSSADGQVVLARPLTDVEPPTEAIWQPLEFLIAVDTTGMVKPPVLTESSRVAAVDAYFQEYLAKGLHIGERLAPGFYRVSIGP